MCSCRCIGNFLSVGQKFGDDDTWYLLECCTVGGLRRDSTARLGNWQSIVSPRKSRITPVELLIDSALSPSVYLETAQQERSMLLAGEKRLLREGNEVDLLCNPKGNYEKLKLILVRLECMCILTWPSKRCIWNLTCLVCPIPNAYAGMQSCIEVMMWCWGGWPATS